MGAGPEWTVFHGRATSGSGPGGQHTSPPPCLSPCPSRDPAWAAGSGSEGGNQALPQGAVACVGTRGAVGAMLVATAHGEGFHLGADPKDGAEDVHLEDERPTEARRPLGYLKGCQQIRISPPASEE